MRHRPDLGKPRLDNRGIVAVEFALVAPVLILMLLGVSEETALLRAQMKVSHAAGLLAKMVAQQTPTVTPGTNGTLGNLCYGAALTMAPLAKTTFAAAIASVTTNTVGTATTTTMDWESDNACAKAATPIGSSAAVALATGTALVPADGDSLIIVKTNYTYTAATHIVLSASYNLSQTIYARPRGDTTIACSSC
jgi:Flp pilus assembly protein TadG